MAWSDKGIEEGAKERKKILRASELFIEVKDRLNRALDWAHTIIVAREIDYSPSGCFSPDSETLVALKIYDELKELDEADDYSNKMP